MHESALTETAEKIALFDAVELHPEFEHTQPACYQLPLDLEISDE